MHTGKSGKGVALARITELAVKFGESAFSFVSGPFVSDSPTPTHSYRRLYFRDFTNVRVCVLTGNPLV